VLRTDYKGFRLCVSVIVVYIFESNDRGKYRVQGI
jgi:hypothetical protein